MKMLIAICSRPLVAWLFAGLLVVPFGAGRVAGCIVGCNIGDLVACIVASLAASRWTVRLAVPGVCQLVVVVTASV